eukprot:GHVP01014805.1.p1 GENE.GHVP01014805.1~~GHVP01014805.1.p1  ORF type:complete len:111 (+),score=10.83 GHVP01014805.1:68-400(+)
MLIRLRARGNPYWPNPRPQAGDALGEGPQGPENFFEFGRVLREVKNTKPQTLLYSKMGNCGALSLFGLEAEIDRVKILASVPNRLYLVVHSYFPVFDFLDLLAGHLCSIA